MITKQVSVFIENKPGRLADVLQIIAEKGINLQALSVADTSNFGILRVLTDKTDELKSLLKENGVTVKTADVLKVSLPDKAGSLAAILKTLSENGITVEYMYAFSVSGNEAVMIIRADNAEKAAGLLTR